MNPKYFNDCRENIYWENHYLSSFLVCEFILQIKSLIQEYTHGTPSLYVSQPSYKSFIINAKSSVNRREWTSKETKLL